MESQMLEQELETVKKATREAGDAIISIAEKHYKTAASQADRSVVTKADIEADKILQRHLRGKFPEYGWLSEETRDDDRRLQCERVWIVDPMDGTREFVMKVPEFVVSVALAENGKIVLGVILNPSTGDLFDAVIGAGTRLNGQSVLCDHELDSEPKVEVSRSDIDKGYFTAYDGILKLSSCGSIAYKMARLATGKSDGTLSVTPKNEWDIAAGVLLVAEAGGRVTDLAGHQHLFNQPDTLVNGVIAASRDAHGIIKKVVDERKQT
jgi:myo-inositol-1(or 4)-monophosphatase